MNYRYQLSFDTDQLPSMETDFLVIGSGSAGMRSAIEANQHGKVLLVTKNIIKESNTRYAQGGIAAAMGEDDHLDLHVEDTLNAGAGLCDPAAVAVMVEEGVTRVKELIEWGVKFDKNDEQKLSFTQEGAHQKRRVLHRGDETGKETTDVLVDHLKRQEQIQVIENCFVLDLLTKDGICYGALAIIDQVLHTIFAKATILSTGGLGHIYQYTSNPKIATGDGYAIAWRAGCKMVDMEFVQFHPTTLFLDGAPHFLISEAVRGEGGILLNARGEVFMGKYHPLEELAPRDVVSRSILAEMELTDFPCVYLDITHHKEDFIRKRFPKIYQTCAHYGLNISTDLIPVRSGAHFMMGGISTNLFTETNVPGFFACGEAACTKVHGANRLASNSLLECLVFGVRAAQAANRYINRQEIKPVRLQFKRMNSPKNEKNLDSKSARDALQALMWKHVGIIRDGKELAKVEQLLDQINTDLSEGNEADIPDFEVQNMLDVAKLITKSAIQRTESRGGHYRRDFPEREDQDWIKHIYIWAEHTSEGLIQLAKEVR